MTEAERLVSDLVNVEGEQVHERRLAIAQTYLDTWRRAAGLGGELADRVARYRTGLVALVAFIRRVSNAQYKTHNDQQLIRQIERILDEDRPATR